MVSRRYLCPATGGEGGEGRLRGDLDPLSLGEDLLGDEESVLLEWKWRLKGEV